MKVIFQVFSDPRRLYSTQAQGPFGFQTPTYDKAENIFYYDNMLTVYLLSEFSDMQANELAASVGGIVVGKIGGSLNVLQIMVESNDLSGLESLASKLMGNENVLYASYDFPMPLSISATDNNPWDVTGTTISDKNNENSPDGNDWWAEVIGSYMAWELADTYESNLTSTRVGVIDSGFDMDHEDLIGKITFLNDYQTNTEDEHGTSVAALISANNNSIGLRGVSDRSELICTDWSPVTNDGKSEEYVNLLSTGEYLEIIKSMLEHDVKVINCSWGIHFMSEDGYAKNLQNDVTFGWLIGLDRVKEIMKEGMTYETYCAYIQALAKKTEMECFALFTGLICGGKNDFLVVQAAGNGFDNGGAGCDAKYNGFFCSMTEETYNLLPAKTREHVTKLGCSYSNLREHAIIVGAIKNNRDTNGNYQMCEFSNVGTMVDICAPGYAVFTAALDNSYQWDESSSGTSLAAPMVSGAAALVWSFAPELTAAEVKETLIESSLANAVGVGNGIRTDYPVLNVGNAVKTVAPKPTGALKEILIDGYWENNIQSTCLYQFREDGTVLMYYVEPGVEITKDALYDGEILTYEVEGNSVWIKSDGYSTRLEWVTKSEPYEWDDGIVHELPDEDPFLYEVDWVYDGSPSDNAMFLVKSKYHGEPEETSLLENTLLTTSGTLEEREYEINSGNKGTAFILKLDETMPVILQNPDMGYNGDMIDISEMQIGFIYHDNYIQENYTGAHITVRGKVIYAHTGHHLTSILLQDAEVIESDGIVAGSEINTEDLFGIWDSGDTGKRLELESAGMLTVPTENGIKNADGNIEMTDMTTGEVRQGAYIIIDSTHLAVYLDLEEYVIDYSFDGQTLILNGDRYSKTIIHDELSGIIGRWVNDGGTFTFSEGGKCYATTRGSTVTEGGEYGLTRRVA